MIKISSRFRLIIIHVVNFSKYYLSSSLIFLLENERGQVNDYKSTPYDTCVMTFGCQLDVGLAITRDLCVSVRRVKEP